VAPAVLSVLLVRAARERPALTSDASTTVRHKVAYRALPAGSGRSSRRWACSG
jgi:hypothetical protein